MTGIQARYGVVAEGDNRYGIYVNLEFSLYDFSNDYWNNQGGREQYLERIKGCYKKHNPKLYDGTGRQLTMYLYDASKHRDLFPKPPRRVYVGVMEKGTRSNSTGYAMDANCDTIMHEALHLMGLVDEYYEFKSNHRLMYPDRAAGPKDSFMMGGQSGFFGIGSKYRLYPAHVNAILYPNCTEKNATYYQCSKYAYETKKSTDVPAICKDRRAWLN